ncbi:unnamed protein product [Triticum turgidum subsp. durum]|uniref:DUF1618 domain-containing protein n=1 Tax=Triticum turgidum subsp. durum TaxID=4567 RepID=A0A9R1RZH1_TRITD|nr:unnamed protein product [Triticum turgidum subsp. durum]
MASPSWIILSRKATAPAAGDDGLPQGAALSLALAAPPRVTTVKLRPAACPVEPDPPCRHKFPCVLAADPSGLLLILTPPPLSERDEGELRTSRDARGVERTIRIGRVPSPRYVVCDLSSATATATASPVPDPRELIFNNDLGVIAAPGGGGRFMVVEFQTIVGGREATLLCFSSESGKWARKKVANPLPRWMWTFSDIVSHGGKLWWVDCVAGLLACDPFAEEPAMEYVQLPAGDVSNGVFRCVEMSCASHGAPKVSMRTLADPSTAEWTFEYEASFSEIWAGDSYKAAGLPNKAPVLALVHPDNPDVVYFFLEQRLFGVDMRAREVVECEPLDPAKSQKKGSYSSGLVFPFELPPMFSAEHDHVACAYAIMHNKQAYIRFDRSRVWIGLLLRAYHTPLS